MESPTLGLWNDHDGSFWNAHQVTLSVWGTTIVQLLLGVLLGCATPQLKNILYRAWDKIALRWKQSSQRTSNRNAANDEERSLLRSGTQSTTYGSAHQALGLEADTSSTAPPETTSQETRKHGKTSQTFVYMTVFVGWALASGLIAMSPQSKLGALKSTNCAVYNLKQDYSGPERRADDLIQAGKEVRAGEYARTCYAGNSVAEPDRCNLFAQPTIPHKCVAALCPFHDRHFCRGTYDALNCSTGWVDASYLGINSKKRPQFSRTSICTPLNMGAGFVHKHYDSYDEEWLFDYNLGSINSKSNPTNFTYQQEGMPFDWAIPAYLVNSYQSSYYRESDRWQPLSPQLDRANDTFLTVMFIVAARILYAAPSSDYIFQTTSRYDNSDYYWNTDPRSRPLACVDYIELRASDGTYYPRIDQEHSTIDREFDYVRAALRRSTIYDSIQSRGGNALDAQAKVHAFFSAELAHNQWALEAENLFLTSLARAQYNAWDIAIGLGREKFIEGSYTNETDQLCGLFKYKIPKPYANFNLVAYVGFALFAVLIIVLGSETNVEFDDPEEKMAFAGKKLVCELLWERAGRVVSKTNAAIVTAYSRTTGACTGGSRDRGHRRTSRRLPETNSNRPSSQSTQQSAVDRASILSGHANIGATMTGSNQASQPGQPSGEDQRGVDIGDQSLRATAQNIDENRGNRPTEPSSGSSTHQNTPPRNNDNRPDNTT